MGVEPTSFGYPVQPGSWQPASVWYAYRKQSTDIERRSPKTSARRGFARTSRFMGFEPMVRGERIELSVSCV
jgi:hypothetical protein